MKFAFELARKNLIRRPFRFLSMAALIMFLSFTVFAGAFMVLSLQNGLQGYQARLGADIIVVPNSAASHGTVDDILLQGITGNYYMTQKETDKIRKTEGIEQISRQFFLTSAKASCCSSRVQIIGFDPETDFTVVPWIRENYDGELLDGELIVGADINVPSDRIITFYGEEYTIKAQLSRTGTGLDQAVYTNMTTIRQMAENAANLLATSPFAGVDIDTAASAVFLKVKDGYAISDVTDDINIHITKVQASSAGNMVSDIARGLGNVSRVIGICVILVWVLAVVILLAVHALLANERRKEFAVLRMTGASRKLLFEILAGESLIVSVTGSLIGLVLALIVVLPLSGTLKTALDLPFLAPSFVRMVLLALMTVILASLAGLFASLQTAKRMTNSETGLLLREDG